ncbi:MAG: hypothetical protein HY526_09005 [Betaproteobacteria bacterium]|nr:hypothetical protein [Betaproteobacteria bacterium]
MAQAQWYELRVAGSAGTSSEIAGSIGIAIGENGRLCSISSGCARRFETEERATEYLMNMTIPGNYRFEAVRCGAAGAAPARAA